jgi:hypothetical protein
MVKIFGKSYYIDVEGIVDKCALITTDENQEEKNEDGTIKTTIEVNIFKYEVIKMCLDRVLNEFQDGDDDNEIGIFALSDKNISLKIAFNTLIKYNILVEDDE